MLHPNQFQVDEAWIAFQLNDVPIQTEFDGEFNCIALMDAASCFILTSELVPADQTESSKSEIHRLLESAYSHRQELPKTLFIPREQAANNLALEAMRRNVKVVRVPQDQLLPFIGEARDGFKEHLGGGRVQ